MRRLFLGLARSAPGRLMIGWLFTHMSFAIPFARLLETDSLIVFHHPSPAHPLHILLVPKRKLRGLTSLRAGDSDFMIDLFAAVSRLVDQFNLEEVGYRLVANGGTYQDVAHLHFHLISDHAGN